MKFYDTNMLLDTWGSLFRPDSEKFAISSVSLWELEKIKQDKNKDPQIKWCARQFIKKLNENQEQCIVDVYDTAYDQEIVDCGLDVTPDTKIIYSAFIKHYDVFVTNDYNCKIIAKKVFDLDVEYRQNDDYDTYTGFSLIQYKDDDDLAEIYNNIYNAERMESDILQNQYMILQDPFGKIVDKYKKKGEYEGFDSVKYNVFDSKHLGKIKPLDEFQECAMDSLRTNQFTILRGPAGTGKSLLALGYLFSELERGNLNKIIIFCNTVATRDTAKLGYYPGDKDEKLLDSQIGNFLISKLGGEEAVLELIEKEQLILLPMADIRGYDTAGMKAGVLVTEAQNMTVDLAKLVIQRISKDSKLIFDGDDAAQVDLGTYAGDNNGMRRAVEVFRGEPYFGTVTLQNIYRSELANKAEEM